MQFHFPQYIDIEDKIFGPLTLKQAVFVAGGLGGAYLAYVYIPYTVLSIPAIFAIGVFTWALAFYSKEKLGRPFLEILEAGFWYFMSEKLYTWKKIKKEPSLSKEREFSPSSGPVTPLIPQGKLSSSSFAIDVRGPQREGRDDERVRGEDSLSISASAEAGAVSQESFILQPKVPQVNTFKAPAKTEHSPYKMAPTPQARSGSTASIHTVPVSGVKK